VVPSLSSLACPRARGLSSLARPRVRLYPSTVFVALLLLCGCDSSKSGPGVAPVSDASFSDAGTASDGAAISDPTAASARDGGAGNVSTSSLDAARDPERPPVVVVGDAGVTPDAAMSASAASDASQSMSGNTPGGAVADAGGSVVTRAGWGDQPCDRESKKPGCNDESLALCICRGPDASGGNEFCCSEQWSYLCVDGLAALPECKFTTNKCCEAHPTDGCADKAVEQCICAEVRRQKQEETAAGRDPALVHDCCSEGWTDFCAILADEVCGAGCAKTD